MLPGLTFVPVRAVREIFATAIEFRMVRDRPLARRDRRCRRGDPKTPHGPAKRRFFPVLRSLFPFPRQGSGTMRPVRPCPQPVVPTANRHMPGPSPGAPSELHAGRLEPGVRRARGVVRIRRPRC